MIRHLDSGEEIKIDYVLSYSFNETCKILALVLAEPEGKKNGLYLMHLDQKELSKVPVLVSEDNLCTNLSWSKEGNKLGFISGTMPQKEKESVDLSLWIWDGKTNKARRLVGKSRIPEGWGIPEKNGLFWSKDGHRLFFGIKPVEFFDTAEKEKENDEEISEQDLFDASWILEKRGVDVWHWDDPFIIPHQKKIWPHVKSKTYLAVCHLDRNSLVILADQELPNVNKPDNPRLGLGMSDVPYRKEQTWSGSFQDIYIISLISGERKKIASRISENAVLSPEGRYILYYKDKHWHLYDTQKANTLNLTEKVGVPFYDEDHDYPSPPGSYGHRDACHSNQDRSNVRCD